MTAARFSTRLLCTLTLLCGTALAAQAKSLAQHWGQIYAVAFSPDGTRVASASASHVLVHDIATRKQLSRVGLQHGPRCIAFAPDGGRLMVDASVIDVGSSQVVETLSKGVDAGVKLNALAFAPDGTAVAIAPLSGAVKLMAPTGGELLHTLNGHSGPVRALAFSPNGDVVATASGDRVRFWSVKWGKVVGDFHSDLKDIRAIAFDPSGASLAVGGPGASVEVWSVEGQRRLRTGATGGGSIATLAFSSDGKALVGGGTGSKILLWDATTLRVTRTVARKGGGSVTALSLAPDGRRALVGDTTGTVRLIEIMPR